MNEDLMWLLFKATAFNTGYGYTAGEMFAHLIINKKMEYGEAPNSQKYYTDKFLKEMGHGDLITE